MTGRRGRVGVLVPAGAVAAATGVVAAVAAGGAAYRVVDLADPGIATSVTSAALQTVSLLSGSLTIGALVRALLLSERRGPERLRIGADNELALAIWASIVWFLTAAALVAVDAADAAGVPIGALAQPGALAHLLSGGDYLPIAWAVVALIAIGVAAVLLIASDFVILVVTAGWAAIGLLAPVLVTHVLVGPGHDFAGDASMFGAPAAGVLLGVLAAVTVRPEGVRAIRLRITVAVTGLIAIAGDAVVLLVELAGRPVLSSPTGWLYLGKDALLLTVVLLVVLPSGRPWRLPSVRVAGAAALAIATAGLTVAIGRIPPPDFFVPTSITQNFLGYDANAAPTPWVLAFDARPSILFITVSVVGIVGYLLAVARLHRRGDRWPPGRTAAWIAGWLVVIVTTSSGVGRYSGASFSVHMALHMSLNMLAPMLLVLGGVTTLLLRATTAHSPREPAGPHEWLNALLHSRVLRLAGNPLYVFAVFVGSYYAVYFTPIFDVGMRYHWSHQLLNVHFLVIGYLFYGLVIGVDVGPHPLPHIGRLGLVLAAMPFHAFFGVAVMTSREIIAATYFGYLHLPWMTLRADQYLGGGIAWSAGELPLVVVVIALVAQWARQDSRLARRTDRHLDSGLDASYDAYNEMLARIAARETSRPTEDAR